MLDENFPSYGFQRSADEPLHTVLFFTHNGSEPVPEYMIKRPAPSTSQNQYAVALVDVHYSSVIYGEVLVKPEWAQPTLSAAEVRANNGPVPVTPIIPDSVPVLLYNPDQSIAIKKIQGGWNKSDSWVFEMPERSFKVPSASQLDQESGDNQPSELSPKIVFQWKRDGRLSKDMTCYMSGRSINGKKSKEPDITVAMYRSGKNEGLTIYEPNMARVDVEDRKGLEVILLLSAIVVKDLYTAPRADIFNTAGGASTPAMTSRRKGSGSNDAVVASGALKSPLPPQQSGSPSNDKVAIETRRLQALFIEEERRERQRRAREEEAKTRKLLEIEEEEVRRKQAEIEKETERLRKQYGIPKPAGGPAQYNSSPPLPSRPSPKMPAMSGGLDPSGWFGPANGGLRPTAPPPRPNSTGPGDQAPQKNGYWKLTNPLGVSPPGPYGGIGARTSVSNLLGVNRSDEEKRKKMKKKSVFF